MARLTRIVALIAVAFALQACESLVEDRIPAFPVSVNIAGAGLWNTFGVHGYGESRDFILFSGERVPEGFPYTSTSRTGYGGVLLISAMDPFTTEVGPVAYDLSCPVERSQTVRVAVDPKTLEAVCPVCGSRYNVTERGGAPVAGPALNDRYQLRLYRVLPNPEISGGGYLITNR